MADSNPSRGPMRKMPTKIAPKPVPTKIAPRPMPMKKPSSSQPTMADREAARRQNESLRNAKVTSQEGKVIESANRSEGGGHKKGGMIMKKATKAGKAMMKKSADTMGRAMVKKAGGGKCYAKGGTASARADGVATKGKTKGKMLARGGKTC